MSKLIIIGHSLGGLTAIDSTAKDKRITACLTIDPWFWPYKDDMQSLTFKTPILSIKSENFYPYCLKFGFDAE